VDFKGPDKHGLGNKIDYAQAWDSPEPFMHVKTILFEKILREGNLHEDYPYDGIMNQIVAGGLVRYAHQEDELVQIRYGWEALDDENVVLHSCIGYVMHPLIYVNGTKPGFLMEMTEDDSDEPTICSFEYRKVFWVGPVR
jgi:hypothetical protein